ncbi:MAG TPA: pilus assembly protein TadG-related protein [Jiangellaceae bacterium]
MQACCDVATPAERDRTTGSDQGAISAFVVVIFTALMMLAGLVVDGGNMINARQKIIDDAEQAARLGANQIDEIALRSTGEVVVVWPEAGYEAAAYLAGLGYDPARIDVSPGGPNIVVVEISDTVEAQLLSLIGLGPFDVSGSAQARPAVGILEEIP